ncbi:MAG: YkgJ family cysteine cluster protein [Elusimicrobia bacterium]|nr:YkgJ family cysteine cluster protein [Elusimicrobiota bacterium]
MEEIHRLKEEILKDYPRLSEDSEFSFSCHPGVACFNRCCADVNIFLTPYDVLRLKGALKMSSREFLKKHTIVPFDKNLKYPVFLLKMEENEGKTCPFVGEKGCGVYRDRPWSCRMYPVGLASPKEGGAEAQKEFYFLLKESCCQGFGEDRKLTVGEWLEAQGVLEYDEMGREWKALTLHKYFLSRCSSWPATTATSSGSSFSRAASSRSSRSTRPAARSSGPTTSSS